MRYSVNDGPGIRTTIFLKGCPLHCKWCHNPESISNHKELLLNDTRCIRCGSCMIICGQHAISLSDGKYITDRNLCNYCGDCVDLCYSDSRAIAGEEYSVDEIMIEIEKDNIFYNESKGGVTFSGGEPLMQYEFLLSVLKECKIKDIHTAIDTTGYTSISILEQISSYTDVFLYDIKSIDDSIHKEFIGVSNKIILENLKKLVEWNKEVIIRIPLIPDVNENMNSMNEIGTYISNIGKINEVHLLPYHEIGIEKYTRLGIDYKMKETGTINNEKLNIYVNLLSKYFPKVSVGG